MKSAWQGLEAMGPRAGTAAEWRQYLGAALGRFQKGFLKATGRPASSYPCPQLPGCWHKVRPRGSGYVGIAKENGGSYCEDILLTRAEVEVWALDPVRLGRAIAEAFACESFDGDFHRQNTAQVATYAEGAVPVLLTLPRCREDFHQAITGLVAKSRRPFILFGPTNRFLDRRGHELLDRVQAEFYDLASHAEVAADGSLSAMVPARELFAGFHPETAERQPAAAPRPQYLIRQEGTRQRGGKQDRTMVSTWRVFYAGQDCLLPPLVGSDLLVYLMSNQARNYNASALTEAVRKSAGFGDGKAANAVQFGEKMGAKEGGSAQGRVGELNEPVLIWDDEDIKMARKKIAELEAEVKEYIAAGDNTSSHYLEAQQNLETWQNALKQSTKLVGKKRVGREMQKGTFAIKANLIRKNIRKVLDGYLRQNCRALFDHLDDKKVLKYGVHNCYQPNPRIRWVFEMKEMKKGT